MISFKTFRNLSISESGTMESMSANLDATDDLVPSLQQVSSIIWKYRQTISILTL